MTWMKPRSGSPPEGGLTTHTVLPVLLAVLLSGCGSRGETYRSFTDYPGFREYYGERCRTIPDEPSLTRKERDLLRKYRPRFVMAPGGQLPIDFYRDYLAYATLRSYPEGKVIAERVDRQRLVENVSNRQAYLDFDLEAFRKEARRGSAGGRSGEQAKRHKPAVYGRVYREKVVFSVPGEEPQSFDLTFLKYNLVFSTSGLAAALPWLHRLILRIGFLDAEDWHELDNFVAVHVVLDERDRPLAVLLAQHNHHRSYLLDHDLNLPPDGRLTFDVALRTNEIYPTSLSTGPVRHRVVQYPLYLKYLLSGRNRPFFSAHDVTYGLAAGGSEIEYELEFLPDCDPFYTAEILLGEPRDFMGRYIGRDGPPGADYYSVPEILPLGKLLKFSYLHDGDAEDIRAVDEAIDIDRKHIDFDAIMEHGGANFYRNWMDLQSADAP